MLKKIYIRRERIKGVTWFRLLGHKKGEVVLVDFPMLSMIQKAGYEILDADLILAEMAKWN